MSFLNKLKDIGSVALAPATGGLSLFAGGEDTLSKVPVLGGLMGAQSDAEKALLKKQEQMAAETKAQQEKNARMRMQALGQSMLAFNPQNQMMAQMFGPQAAFTPQQFAAMGNDPGARSAADFTAARQEALARQSPDGRNAPSRHMPGWTAADIQRMQENERRKRAIEQQMAPLGAGPAPLNLPAPAAPRRY